MILTKTTTINKIDSEKSDRYDTLETVTGTGEILEDISGTGGIRP